MFRASLRPSSGGQTALSPPIVFCRVVAVAMLEIRLASCVHCGVGCLTLVKQVKAQSDLLTMGVKTPETC